MKAVCMRIILLLLLTFESTWAIARPLSDEEAKSVQIVVDIYISAVRDDEVRTILFLLPPRVLEHQASILDISRYEYIFRKNIEAISGFRGESVRNLEVKLTGVDIDNKVLADGTRVSYGFLRISSVVALSGDDYRIEESVMIIHENSEWYVVYPHEFMIDSLLEVYPFSWDIEFPSSDFIKLSE